MRYLRTQTVSLAELQANLFVRQVLDQDHVLFLAGLYAGGVRFEPIQVDENMSIVDGRHRREMFEFEGLREVEVEVFHFENEAEMIATAFKANCGGSKPPTPSDIDHTIELLLERGGNPKSIADILGLPAKMVRKYVDDVKSRLARAKLMRAVDAVLNGGLSVAKASEQYGVDLDKLKEHLAGKKKKRRDNGVDALQRMLTFNQRSMSQKNANAFRKLSAQYDDGDVTRKQIEEIFSHLKDLHRKSARALAEWEARFSAKFKGEKSEAA